MAIRITGMNSGMDTDSMVQELVKASSTGRDKLKKAQTKLQWKQDVWKDVNTKVYSFFNKKLNNLRFESAFNKKKTTIADPSVATVIASDNAVNGTQTLSVHQLAKSGYLTGGKLERADKAEVTADTTLSELGVSSGTDATIEIKVKGSKSGEEKTLSFNGDTKIKDVISALKDQGITASFDSTNKRIFLSASGSGADKDFSVEAGNVSGLDALNSLGLLTQKNVDNFKTAQGYDSLSAEEQGKINAVVDKFDKRNADDVKKAVRIEGQDAKISLNGAIFTSDTNSFSINGLTITANSVSAKSADGKSFVETAINTADDNDGIYNMIKDFFKDYNDLIKELDTKYNAESSKGYEPLTDDEKDAMNDTEIEDWEKKIKDSLLRRDQDLGTLINSLKTGMLATFEVNGKKMSLSNFGINTMGYFAAADNEKGVYHIDGDEDDESTSGNTDVLKSMIANDPEAVKSFFTQLIGSMYKQVNGIMSRTDYRSIYKVYDDKRLKSEYDDYTSKIKAAEDKLTNLEDRYYKKFAQMETAMGKINSQQSYISGLFQ